MADISPEQLQKLLDALQFGNTYPGFAPVSPSEQGGPTAAAPTALQQRVNTALQGVLGRAFKEGDHRSFRLALEASFEAKDVGGRRTYEWKPRAYPLTGGSDLGGGVTGAQYSLVSLANVLYGQTLDLIDNLYSLIPDVDEEQLEAARAVFRSTWSEFITELGREGGPRAPKADSHADSIYRTGTGALAPTVRGHLVRFGRLLGMIPSQTTNAEANRLLASDISLGLRLVSGGVVTERPEITRFNVLTTDEEENLTNFIALIDIYLTVSQSWRSYRDTFLEASAERDLGTGLLSLERLFSVLEESVNEVYVAMDSVNVDQAERLVLRLNVREGPESTAPVRKIVVEDFLSWVLSFASAEAPQLVRDGGKWGVDAVLQTARKLSDVAEQFGRSLDNPGAADLPPAFGHSRVRNPVDEMSHYLSLIVVTAEEILGIKQPQQAPVPLPVPVKIQLLAPNGGEIFQPGQQVNIQWRSIGAQSHSVQLSTDGGATFVDIPPQLSGATQSFQWTVPDQPTARARVRVVARDAAGNEQSDASDADITIQATPQSQLIVALLAPRGGETFRTGQQVDIRWGSTGAQAHSVQLSTDGGVNFTDISSQLPGTAQSFPWTVSDQPTARARIRVTATDAANHRLVAESADFKIERQRPNRKP